jgi:hypothetical protein
MIVVEIRKEIVIIEGIILNKLIMDSWLRVSWINSMR